MLRMRNLPAFLTIIIALVGCDQRPKQRTTYSIASGTQKSSLFATNDINAFRTEIQSHIHKSWTNNNYLKTDWMQAKSTFQGTEQNPNLRFGKGSGQQLRFTSTRYTDVFRLNKLESGLTVLEVQKEEGIRQKASTNAEDWPTIVYLTKSVLSDSLLKSMLSNNGW